MNAWTVSMRCSSIENGEDLSQFCLSGLCKAQCAAIQVGFIHMFHCPVYGALTSAPPLDLISDGCLKCQYWSHDQTKQEAYQAVVESNFLQRQLDLARQLTRRLERLARKRSIINRNRPYLENCCG